jgi:hypothetical protein
MLSWLIRVCEVKGRRMIRKDGFGCIGQHSVDDRNYLDFGDSAAKTGIMALCGDKASQDIVHLFVTADGLGTRYPFNQGGNLHPDNPNNFTRDQLIQLTAGLWASDRSNTAKKLLLTHLKRGFLCQNSHDLEGNLKPWWGGRDVLTPSHIGHLIMCSKAYILYPFLLFCLPWLLLDIIWNAKFTDKEEEQNQIFCMVSVAGRFWLWLYMRLNVFDFITSQHNYWCTWRDQSEIYFAIMEYARLRLVGSSLKNELPD